jgi:hypothetical protein
MGRIKTHMKGNHIYTVKFPKKLTVYVTVCYVLVHY